MDFHGCYDGGTKYISYFSRELVKQGVDVTVVSSSLDDKSIREKFVERVRYVFLPPRLGGWLKLNSPYKLAFSWNLRKFLEKEDFDVLHSFGMLGYFYLHQKKRKPVIFQGFGLEPFFGSDSLGQKGLKKLYTKLFIQKPWLYCLNKSDMIASEGDFQNKDIEGLGVPRGKIFNLMIGLDLEKIEEFKRKSKDKRKELGIKQGGVFVLSVNQIAPDKGIDDLINGFALFKKEVKNAKLVMVGAGVLEGMMNKMIKEKGLDKDVIHLKNISEQELYDLYFSADVYISAALQKDWIMGIQEAMACGLPVVSSAQRFLVEDGKNGYVVGMKNPKGISEGLLKIYDKGNGKKMGAVGKGMAGVYGWDKIAKGAIGVYEKLV